MNERIKKLLVLQALDYLMIDFNQGVLTVGENRVINKEIDATVNHGQDFALIKEVILELKKEVGL